MYIKSLQRLKNIGHRHHAEGTGQFADPQKTEQHRIDGHARVQEDLRPQIFQDPVTREYTINCSRIAQIIQEEAGSCTWCAAFKGLIGLASWRSAASSNGQLSL